MSDDLRPFLDLKRRIQDALREQHAEWVEASGDCPTCEEYARRLDLLLKLSGSSEAPPELNQPTPK